MLAILIRQQVIDYAAWQEAFEDVEAVRQAHGCLRGRLFGNLADPNEIMILLEWDDLERARLFAQSDDLRDGFRQPNVRDEPDVWFLSEANESRR